MALISYNAWSHSQYVCLFSVQTSPGVALTPACLHSRDRWTCEACLKPIITLNCSQQCHASVIKRVASYKHAIKLLSHICAHAWQALACITTAHLLTILQVGVQWSSPELLWVGPENNFLQSCLFSKHVVARTSFRDVLFPFRWLLMLSSHLSFVLLRGIFPFILASWSLLCSPSPCTWCFVWIPLFLPLHHTHVFSLIPFCNKTDITKRQQADL